MKYGNAFPRGMKTENVPARHAFEPAPEERAFRFANGERARSLEELARLLPALPDHVLDYHRPHYAAWLADVVGDPPLAERFRHYGESGMAADEYRRVLTDLLARRLEELKAPPPEPVARKKSPRRKSPAKKAGKKD